MAVDVSSLHVCAQMRFSCSEEKKTRQDRILQGVGFENKSANLERGGKKGGTYYPSIIIMQTDRRQVGRVDKSVNL